MRISISRLMRGGWYALVLASVVLTGCADAGPTDPVTGPKPVATVLIAPKSGVWTGTLRVGQSVELAARPLAADGTELPAAPTVWASTDTAVVVVTGGVLVARGEGTVEVTAMIGGRVGRIQVVVMMDPPPPVGVARVQVSPQAMVLEVGEARQYTARAFDDADNELFGRVVSWSTTAPQVATITPGGVVLAVSGGYADVVATIEGRTAAVGLTVASPEQVGAVIVTPAQTSVFRNMYVDLDATVLSTSGGTLEGRAVTWVSESPSIAQVGTDGLILGIAQGTARIRATSGGVSGWATVEVREIPTGPVTTYDLRGTESLPVPYVEIGGTQWTDPSGTTHDAFLVVTGGVLTLDSGEGTYQQSFRVETYLMAGAPGQAPVVVSQVTDAGRVLYDFMTGAPILESTRSSGVYHRGELRGAGEFVISQSVLGTAIQRWVWVIR